MTGVSGTVKAYVAWEAMMQAKSDSKSDALSGEWEAQFIKLKSYVMSGDEDAIEILLNMTILNSPDGNRAREFFTNIYGSDRMVGGNSSKHREIKQEIQRQYVKLDSIVSESKRGDFSNFTLPKIGLEVLAQAYGDPATGDHVRKEIMRKSYEAVEGVLKDRRGGVDLSKIAAPILYLAGLYADDVGKSGSKAGHFRDEIEKLLKNRMDPDDVMEGVYGPLKPLDKNRFVVAEELQKASRSIAKLHIPGSVLEFGNENFSDQLNRMLDGAEKFPCAIFVNSNNHWVTLLFCENNEGGGNLDCLMFDSNIPARGYNLCSRVEGALKNALGERLRGFAGVGDNLQEGRAGNACGPFSILAVKAVGEAGISNFEEMKEFLKAKAEEWLKMDSSAIQAVVAIERANMMDAEVGVKVDAKGVVS